MSWSCVQSRHECNTPQPAFSAVKTENILDTIMQFFLFQFTLSNYPYAMKNISIMNCVGASPESESSAK